VSLPPRVSNPSTGRVKFIIAHLFLVRLNWRGDRKCAALTPPLRRGIFDLTVSQFTRIYHVVIFIIPVERGVRVGTAVCQQRRSYTCRICRRYNYVESSILSRIYMEDFGYFVIVLFGRFVGVRHTPSFIIFRGIGIILHESDPARLRMRLLISGL
jgi:hypothetical protein